MGVSRYSWPVGILMLVAPGEAGAQAGDSAAAQELFEQARALMARGRPAEACPKLEESHRLDPGSGTLLNLALCYERTGRLASAWTKYLEAAAAARTIGNAPRELEARAKADALRPRLSRLSVDVDPQVRDVPGLEVLRDGQPVGSAQWGIPIPADEGEHTVEARAAGYTTWRGTAIVKGEGEKTALAVPPLVRAKSVSAAAAPPKEPPPHEIRLQEGALGTQKVLALVAGGIGLAGIGAGVVFGLRSMDRHDEAEKYCSGSACTSARGETAGEEAYAAGTLATIGFVVGAVGVTSGTILWFTAPDSSTTVGVGPGSVSLRGVW